ncbi:innexin inx7 isoform X2 [Wyeomyia smithii]|uniref:innexin inx7 isoform X2 n=1 Tax=Wyeomyia smithii TaxID=174621 RepID=UPI002467DC8C|nr:innexin inx7 isoform X2 [Wyeomyia smithii]
MLNTFSVLKPHLKFKNSFVSIDNLAFKFHYRATFAILLVCTLLVTSRQYVGEHIRCITGSSIPEHDSSVPHPGVGHMINEDPVKYHAYYQWVPFVLFLQALMFYFPHYIWKTMEGGKIRKLADGLRMVELSHYYKENNSVTFDTKYTLHSKSEIDKKILQVRNAFERHRIINHLWAFKLVFCEFLNLINVLIQVRYTNKFLSGRFYHLGIDFINEDFDGTMDVLDTVFPKVTKCHFHKYGHSGTIQKHDALCVMALNVINEKIFSFLWFWYGILVLVSICALIWRIQTYWLHGRSTRFNEIVFSFACPGNLSKSDIGILTRQYKFSDWLFLYYLARNMDAHLFKSLFRCIMTPIVDVEATLTSKLIEDSQYNENAREN